MKVKTIALQISGARMGHRMSGFGQSFTMYPLLIYNLTAKVQEEGIGQVVQP